MKKFFGIIAVVVVFIGILTLLLVAAEKEDRNNAVKLSQQALAMGGPEATYRVACFTEEGKGYLRLPDVKGITPELIDQARSGKCYVTVNPQ